MKTVGGAIWISVVLIALASCNTVASESVETLMSTQTPLPPKINLPTETSLPSQIPSASSSPLPSESPYRVWEGVPIMPNGIEEQSASQRYSFVINDLVDNVNTFYQEEMANFGWKLLNGKGNEEQSFMSFTKDGNTIDMTVVLQSDGQTSVTFEKQAQTP